MREWQEVEKFCFKALFQRVLLVSYWKKYELWVHFGSRARRKVMEFNDSNYIEIKKYFWRRDGHVRIWGEWEEGH